MSYNNSDSHYKTNMGRMSNNSDSHCKESDCCSRKIIDKSWESSINEMSTIYNKYGLDHDLVSLLVEL